MAHISKLDHLRGRRLQHSLALDAERLSGRDTWSGAFECRQHVEFIHATPGQSQSCLHAGSTRPLRQQRGGAGPRARPAFLQSCAAGRVPCNSPMITSHIPDDLDAPPATRHPGIPLIGRHSAVTFVAQALARPPWHREVSPKAGPARRLACALPRGRRRRRATHLMGSISAILSVAPAWPRAASCSLPRHARCRAHLSRPSVTPKVFTNGRFLLTLNSRMFYIPKIDIPK
jgi:hypothetical protein